MWIPASKSIKTSDEINKVVGLFIPIWIADPIKKSNFNTPHKWSPINLYERHFNQPTQQERQTSTFPLVFNKKPKKKSYRDRDKFRQVAQTHYSLKNKRYLYSSSHTVLLSAYILWYICIPVCFTSRKISYKRCPFHGKGRLHIWESGLSAFDRQKLRTFLPF